MEQIKTFFFDSYAFYEIIAKNPDYEKAQKDIAIITTRLNLMELHYGLLRTEGKDKADKIYDAYLEFAIEINDSVIKSQINLGLRTKTKTLIRRLHRIHTGKRKQRTVPHRRPTV